MQTYMLHLIIKTRFKAKTLLPNTTKTSHLSDKDHNQTAKFAFYFRVFDYAC
ncbi:hypothetical protein VCHE25_0940 [Vibrio cholerae HE-25]|nr:hypothetical protein VCHE25_0940 [Vibrio cholerae HE-25]